MSSIDDRLLAWLNRTSGALFVERGLA